MRVDTACPSCGQTLRLANYQAGKKVTCPTCRATFSLVRPNNLPSRPAGPSPIPIVDDLDNIVHLVPYQSTVGPILLVGFLVFVFVLAFGLAAFYLLPTR